MKILVWFKIVLPILQLQHKQQELNKQYIPRSIVNDNINSSCNSLRTGSHHWCWQIRQSQGFHQVFVQGVSGVFFQPGICRFFLWTKVRREDKNRQTNWWLSLVHSWSFCWVPGPECNPWFTWRVCFWGARRVAICITTWTAAWSFSSFLAFLWNNDHGISTY